MYDLSHIFKPITANLHNKYNHQEVLPCSSLQPFIQCFWGTFYNEMNAYYDNLNNYYEFVIPDACMDIIFEIDDTTNEINSVFCGINNAPFSAQVRVQPNISKFAIRFNFWGGYLFADKTMQNTLNRFLNVEEYFSNVNKEFEKILTENKSFHGRVQEVEKILIKKLLSKYRLNDNFQNAVYYLLKEKGVITVSELCRRISMSNRQLERLFLEYTGTSPKKVANIVRFQNVLQDLILSKGFSQQDVIFEYNFFDQSHLIKDFKKYTGRTPIEVIQQIK